MNAEKWNEKVNSFQVKKFADQLEKLKVPCFFITIAHTGGYYCSPNIAGDQLHFLTFMGSWWGYGEPRFPDELVIGWTKHINNNSGSVTWDVPLSNDGIILESFYKQLKALGKSISR